MDLSKLSPAPWRTENWDTVSLHWLQSNPGKTDMEFIALARYAFDVMLRRGWSPALIVNGANSGTWVLDRNFCMNHKNFLLWCMRNVHDDPFTALVEADKWYTENVENKHGR